MTKDELHGQLTEIMHSIPGAIFKLMDSTGTKDDRYYYCDIVIQNGTSEYKYDIKYEKENSFWDNTMKSQLDLIGAFDSQLKTGGYKNEDTDVKRLTDIFERIIIDKINGKNTSR